MDGRKRHREVDPLGLLRVVVATAANPDDGTHAPTVPARLTAARLGRPDAVRGDGTHNNRTPDEYRRGSRAGYEPTVVERPPGTKGLVLLPYRRVVERTNARTGKYRRDREDDERTTASAEGMVQVSMIHLMLRRLAPDGRRVQAASKYPRKTLQKVAELPA